MNYIELINRFWRLRRSVRITSLQADVYFCLVQECNLRGWPEEFKMTNKLLCLTIGIAEPSLAGARRRLAQLELISFTGGVRNIAAPCYKILPVLEVNKRNFGTSDNTDNDGRKESVSHAASPLNIKQNKKKDTSFDSFGLPSSSLDSSGKEERKPAPFVPPTVQEVEAYCTLRGNTVDAVRFVNFYASKGWMLKHSPMKNWKAVVCAWEKSSFSDKRPSSGRTNTSSTDTSHETGKRYKQL